MANPESQRRLLKLTPLPSKKGPGYDRDNPKMPVFQLLGGIIRQLTQFSTHKTAEPLVRDLAMRAVQGKPFKMRVEDAKTCDRSTVYAQVKAEARVRTK
jgi:hypothetical protein